MLDIVPKTKNKKWKKVTPGMLRWNLGQDQFSTIKIYYITHVEYQTPQPISVEEIRMLCLSHQLAQFGLPAFFVKGAKCFNVSDAAGVIVFDYEDGYSKVTLPEWVNVETNVWEPKNGYLPEQADLLQRAITLRTFYEFQAYNPIYFTTFFVLPYTSVWPEPVIMQIFPVLKEDNIYFRTTYDADVGLIIGSKCEPQDGNFVLISPYENPFRVSKVENGIISVSSPKEPNIEFEMKNLNMVLLTKIPEFLEESFVKTKPKRHTDAAPHTPIRTTNFTFDNPPISREVVESFFIKKFGQNKKKETKQETQNLPKNSEFETPEPPFDDILSEVVGNPILQKIITKAIGVRKCAPQTQRETIFAFNPQHSSTFLSFRPSFATARIPRAARTLLQLSETNYERIEPPMMVVNRAGSITTAPARLLIEQWQFERMMPVMGPKEAFFMIFFDAEIDPLEISTFADHLTHQYSQCNFGSLLPNTQHDPFVPCDRGDLNSAVDEFYSSDSNILKREIPVLSFVISKGVLGVPEPRRYAIYLTAERVLRATETDVEAIAFEVYALNTPFRPAPFEAASSLFGQTVERPKIHGLFFGFRYQPPFVVQRRQLFGGIQTCTLHVCVDFGGRRLVWTDDTGSVMQASAFTGDRPLTETAIKDLLKLFEGEVRLQIDVGIIAEIVTEKMLRDLSGPLMLLNGLGSVFSLFPTPFVQAEFSDVMTDDVFVQAPVEVRFGHQSAWGVQRPLASGFVIAPQLQAFHVGLYVPRQGMNPREQLMEYCQEMSRLSWASIRPGCPYRSTSFPPHMAHLMTSNATDSHYFTRFEFLPAVTE